MVMTTIITRLPCQYYYCYAEYEKNIKIKCFFLPFDHFLHHFVDFFISIAPGITKIQNAIVHRRNVLPTNTLQQH